jgi:hypothetical protein
MWFLVKVFLKIVHKHSSNVPLKDALPNYHTQTQKDERVLLPKKPLSMLGTQK